MARLMIPPKDVLWCWSCNKVSQHSIEKKPEFYGGWIITTCRTCGEKQFISMFIRHNGRLEQRDVK